MSTISELSARLAALMHEKSFTPHYIRGAIRYCEQFAAFRKSKKLQHRPLHQTAALWLAEIRKAHYSTVHVNLVRKTLERIVALSRGEDPSWTLTSTRFVKTNEYYESVSREIRRSAKWTSISCARNCQSTSRTFFRWLLDHGIRSFRSVSLEEVRSFYLEKSAKVKEVRHLRYTLSGVCDFLRETGRIAFDTSGLFRLKIPTRSCLKGALDDVTLGKLVGQTDVSDPVELRDHAIVLLAASTGMRAIDIVSLRLDSIDWRSGEITTIQRKTGVKVSLPLPAGVGEAIRNYILRGRPATDSPALFVRSKAPRANMTRQAMRKVFVNVCRRTGVEHRPGMGFHSFRRTLGRNLVRSGSGIPMVSQVLGHTALRSSERYIALSGDDLAICALGFDGIRPEGRWADETH